MNDDPFADLARAGECDDCHGEGVIYGRRDADGRWHRTKESERPTHTRRCKCALDRSQARRFQKVNREIPATFRNMSFDRAPLKDLTPAAQRKLKSYLSDLPARVQAGKGLWLSGTTGSSKTAAACLVVQRAREAGLGAEFWPVPELLVRLARVRHDDAYVDVDHEEQLHSLLSDVPLLVLDDLSAAKTTPWALEQLYVIINRRYNIGDERATLITTDVDEPTLARMFGGRTIRRLRDITREIDCDWPDRSAQAA